MFGNLLGTLQKFKQDETRVKVREQKKKEVEKKIEEKTEKEKEEANRTKHDLFSEKRKQQQEIKTLKVLTFSSTIWRSKGSYRGSLVSAISISAFTKPH